MTGPAAPLDSISESPGVPTSNSRSNSRLLSCILMLQRFTLVAWVGGAALFVITSVAEQVSPHFDSVARDHLATIRFPLYYKYGAGTLGVALVSSIVATMLSRGAFRKWQLVILTLTVLAAGGAAIDYKFVYCPLQEMITPPGKARTQEFVTLHKQSRDGNTIHVTLALAAALAACWGGGAGMRNEE